MSHRLRGCHIAFATSETAGLWHPKKRPDQNILLWTGRLVFGLIGLWPVFGRGRLRLRANFALVRVAAVRRHHAKIMLGVLK